MLSNILLLLLHVLFVLPRNIPSYVKFCHRNDPDFRKCIIESSNEVFKHGYEPIPDMDLPIIDPLKIDTVSIDTGGAVVKIHVDLINCTIQNMAKAIVTHLVPNLENARISGQLYFPSVTAASDYKMKGKILTFDIEADGSLTYEAQNITMDVEWYGKYYTKNEMKHMMFDKIETKSDIQEVKIYFYKLFGDNEKLTETVNAIINENAQEIKKDVDVIIGKAIGDNAMIYLNRVFNALPIDELFPED
ncbi:hypothetical protein FQR65_LT06039 [Abscondita terminalis]|nr:hypothetical protein FQR65_LT06039 [Abscondita terminalis]